MLINLLLDLRAETDGAHDTIAEFLVQDSLISIAIVLNNLIQSVDQRLDRWHWSRAAAIWEAQKLCLEDLVVCAKDLAQLLDIFWRCLCLTVEEGGDGDFATSEFLCNCFEGKAFGGFCVKEGL